MKRIIPNIQFENCKEALEYYKDVFGGEVRNLQTSDGTEEFKAEPGKIIHVELHITNEIVLYLVDNFGGQTNDGNVSLIIELDTEEEMNGLYEKLKERGNIKFELQKTLWGALHAIVTDPYGVTWGLNYMLK